MERARRRGGSSSRGFVVGVLAWSAAAGVVAGASASEPERIDFPRAVEIALEQNSALQRTANEMLLDRAAITQAKLRFVPDLRWSASGSRSFSRSSEDDEGGGPGDRTGGWDASSSFSTGLSSGVVLFDGFANLAELSSARREAAAGRQDLERARQTVVFDVISGYLTMIEASEQLRVREENLAAQERQEERVSALVDGGQRPISDLYQQQAAVASARLAAVEARRALELGRVDLVQALQLDPARDYDFATPPLPEADPEEPEPVLEELLARAFAQRPDLLAQTERLAAARDGVEAARGGRWPSLSLSASYGARASSTSEDSWQDQLSDARSASLGLSLSFPLFDRLSVSNDIQRARISAENLDLTLADLRQQVALQVRRALLDWHAVREQLRAAVAQERAARQALEATGERYAVGEATLYEVTLSRSDLVSAASARVRARYALLWQGRLLDYYVGELDPGTDLAGEEARS